jgi:hypothetical protein
MVGDVISGRAELTIEGQTIKLEPGDSWLLARQYRAQLAHSRDLHGRGGDGAAGRRLMDGRGVKSARRPIRLHGREVMKRELCKSFRRNAHGSWTCTRQTMLTVGAGRRGTVDVNQTVRPGELLGDYDLAAHLEQVCAGEEDEAS